MTKKYTYLLLLFCFFSTANLLGQESRGVSKTQNNIEGLSFYPNPVGDGKIYISSKSNADKEVIIFDVLGKKVLQAALSNSKELNISNILPGVYIIKFREGDTTATRKLIVK